MGIFKNMFKISKNQEQQPPAKQEKNNERGKFVEGLQWNGGDLENPPKHNERDFVEKVLIHLGADKSILNNPGVLDEIKNMFEKVENQDFLEEAVEEYSQNPNPTEKDFLEYLSELKGDRIFTKQELDFMHKEDIFKKVHKGKMYTMSVDSKTGSISFQSIEVGKGHEQVDFSRDSKGNVIRNSSKELINNPVREKTMEEFNSDGVEMKVKMVIESKFEDVTKSYSIERDSDNPFVLKCEGAGPKTEIKEFSVGCYESLDERLSQNTMQWEGLRTREEALEIYDRNEHEINMELISKKSRHIRNGEESKIRVVKGIEKIRDSHMR